MYLLGLGLLLVALKLLGVAPVADWPWWGVMLPFPLVSFWWAFCDLTGITKKRVAEREESRRIARMRKIIARNNGRNTVL
ncbi:TIGR04438 family Trp-rich protein [Ramlibacter rhizophilus]|uniref:TIGR04438 family Trp-rich protein n=1 Tax=Ramlibacter rhizophilus TaxID=1781167 RepID=A0A4Z0BXC4_9BURK|nr:TIGR04438 family Trp-rich protein [Ramlibacter rhizophilus]TFZ03352.1 TIGR04438 family Trp-rich protein [Ramlibacter rhizophilus]